jgi:acyl-CoA thioester hydrolase
MPTVKMMFEHEIFNEQGVLLNTGHVVLVFMDAAKRKACRAPKRIMDVFAKYF